LPKRLIVGPIFIKDEDFAKKKEGNYKKFFTEEKRQLVSSHVIENI